MSEEFLPRTDDELVRWATRFVTVATTNATAAGLTPAQVTEINTLNTTVKGAIDNIELKKSQLKGATSAKNTARNALIGKARELNRVVQAKPGVSDDLKLQLGLKIRTEPEKKEGAYPPEALQVTGTDNEGNLLRWKHGLNKRGVIYEVFAAFEGKGVWTMIGATTRTSFDHSTVTAGVGVFYQVRATRRNLTSGWSNTVSVFTSGSIPPTVALTVQKAA